MNTSTSGISHDVVELKDMVKALLLDKKSQNQAHAIVKAVEESFVTCGGAHSYQNCLATDGNVYRDNIQEFISQASAVNYNQRNTSYRIEGLKLGLRALTGQATGSMIGELTGSEVMIGYSVGTTKGWTSSVLSLLVGCTISLVASSSFSTTLGRKEGE
nr:hypothetical protein [Tanacetum cinerariifolium]